MPLTSSTPSAAAGTASRSSAAGDACAQRPDITNRWQQTSVPHIYAAGDCAGPFEIVHLAIRQGELAARHAAGVKKLKPVDYSLLLNVVFTDPQLATIGRLERELDERGVRYLQATYPFNDHGKSILMDANYGYVKVIAEPNAAGFSVQKSSGRTPVNSSIVQRSPRDAGLVFDLLGRRGITLAEFCVSAGRNRGERQLRRWSASPRRAPRLSGFGRRPDVPRYLRTSPRRQLAGLCRTTVGFLRRDIFL